MRYIDISRGVMETPPYPGDPAPKMQTLASHGEDGYCLQALHMCLHTATHIDAPLHYLPGGSDIAALDLSLFYGPCRVMTVPTGPIDASCFEHVSLLPRMLLRGEGYLLPGAAEYLRAQGVALVGTDRESIGIPSSEAEMHRALLDRGMAILENANLDGAEDGDYVLSAFPLKITGAEGSPCRAVLIRE